MHLLTNAMQQSSFVETRRDKHYTRIDTVKATDMLLQAIPETYAPTKPPGTNNLLIRIDNEIAMIPGLHGQEETWNNPLGNPVFFDALIITPKTVYVIDVIDWQPTVVETIPCNFNPEDFEHKIAQKRGVYIRKENVKIKLNNAYEYLIREGAPDDTDF